MSKEDIYEEDIEQIDETGDITEPFDPNLIKVETHQLTLLHIIERLKYNEINLFTEFQRRKDLWDATRQSRLIESVLLRLPIPSFYFDGQDDDLWQVVDGLQRVNTIKRFVIDNTLILGNLEFLTNLNNYSYDQLPRDLQRRIKSFPIVVYLIQKETPEKAKYTLFKRINTGGLVLRPQEIRHALNQGISANYIKELAEMEEFKEATGNAIRPERMDDREFVTRFVAFYLNYENYKPDLDSFLNESMAKISRLTEDEREEMKENFKVAMVMANHIFGNNAFRKLNVGKRRFPINKALFETVSVNFAFISDAKRVNEFIEKKDEFLEQFTLLMEDEAFVSAITSGTGQKDKVETRFIKLYEIIRETIGA
jgi:hypothetical protein